MTYETRQTIGGYIVGQIVGEMCRSRLVGVEVDEKGFTVRFSGGNEVNKEIFRAMKDRVAEVAAKGYRVVSMTRASLKEQMKHYGFVGMVDEGGKSDVLFAVQGEGFAGPVEAEVEDVSAVHLFEYENDLDLVVRGVAAEGKKELKRAVSQVTMGEKCDHRRRKDLWDGFWLPAGVAMRKEVKKKIEEMYEAAGCVEVRGKDLVEIGRKLQKSVWQWGYGEAKRGMMEASLGSKVFFFRQDHIFLLQFVEKISKILHLEMTYFLNGEEVEAPLRAESGDTLIGVAFDGYAQPLTIVELEFGKGEVIGTLCESVEKLMVVELENQ